MTDNLIGRMTFEPKQKVWGTNTRVFCKNCAETHVLRLRPDPASGKRVCCSWHTHSMKFNRFYVVDGMLEVEQEVANKCDKDGIPAEDDDIGTHVERVLLNTGESLTIAPGVKHRFIVLSDALVVESVWAERITDDICRFNEGHVMEK